MNDAQDTPQIDPAALRAQRLARLDVLADIGLGLAKRLAREAEAAEVGTLDGPAVAMAYARIARAVRQCLFLQEKLETAEALRRAKAAEAAEATPLWRRGALEPNPKKGKPSSPRRNQVIEVMVDLIDRKGGDTQAEFDAMDDEFCECLEDYGDRDFERRPLSAIIAEICNALGVEPDWDLWAGQDWAIEEAETNSPGSPYAGRTAAGEEGGLPPPRPFGNGGAAPEHPPP